MYRTSPNHNESLDDLNASRESLRAEIAEHTRIASARSRLKEVDAKIAQRKPLRAWGLLRVW